MILARRVDIEVKVWDHIVMACSIGLQWVSKNMLKCGYGLLCVLVMLNALTLGVCNVICTYYMGVDGLSTSWKILLELLCANSC